MAVKRLDQSTLVEFGEYISGLPWGKGRIFRNNHQEPVEHYLNNLFEKLIKRIRIVPDRAAPCP